MINWYGKKWGIANCWTQIKLLFAWSSILRVQFSSSLLEYKVINWDRRNCVEAKSKYDSTLIGLIRFIQRRINPKSCCCPPKSAGNVFVLVKILFHQQKHGREEKKGIMKLYLRLCYWTEPFHIYTHYTHGVYAFLLLYRERAHTANGVRYCDVFDVLYLSHNFRSFFLLYFRLHTFCRPIRTWWFSSDFQWLARIKFFSVKIRTAENGNFIRSFLCPDRIDSIFAHKNPTWKLLSESYWRNFHRFFSFSSSFVHAWSVCTTARDRGFHV